MLGHVVFVPCAAQTHLRLSHAFSILHFNSFECAAAESAVAVPPVAV
jgi:hypothetical protein